MNIKINKSEISGSIIPPASKSVMQRLVAIAVAGQRDLTIKNPSYCDDCLAALQIARLMGFDTEKTQTELNLIKISNTKAGYFYCGESGLCMRMFPPVLALSCEKKTIDGADSLRKRPLDMIEKPLEELGMKSKSRNVNLCHSSL